MNRSALWNAGKALSLAGWLFILFGLIFLDLPTAVRIAWWVVLLVWGIGHPVELTVALPLARQKGIRPQIAVAKTLLFGVFWWEPLRTGPARR
jgi:uncharacterized protein YhhL (DUF1145 family)